MQEAKEASDKPRGGGGDAKRTSSETPATRKVDRRAERAKRELDDEAAAASERALGRGLALGVPLLTVGASIATGVATSAGPALLVLGAGALLGTITLMWASLRTLGGDAPLPEDLELMASRTDTRGALETRKRSALRALKDLETEHALGKIDEADYSDLATRYREEAKDVLRELDEELGPRRDQAEEIARKHLEKRGLTGDERATPDDDQDEAAPDDDKHACAKCATENDADAAFCKRCGAPLAADAATAATTETEETESSDDDANQAES